MRISDWSSDVCSSDLTLGPDLPDIRMARSTRSARRRAGAIEGSARMMGLVVLCGVLPSACALLWLARHDPKRLRVLGRRHAAAAQAPRRLAVLIAPAPGLALGRASYRARVCQSVEISEVDVYVKTLDRN